MMIYNLRTVELFHIHFESISLLMDKSPHTSVFKGLDKDSLAAKLSKLIENEGLILKATYGKEAAGVLIAEVRNGNEFGILEFLIDPKAEDRLIDLLFSQCERQLKRRNYRGIYCNHDWFLSLKNPLISNKFTKGA